MGHGTIDRSRHEIEQPLASWVRWAEGNRIPDIATVFCYSMCLDLNLSFSIQQSVRNITLLNIRCVSELRCSSLNLPVRSALGKASLSGSVLEEGRNPTCNSARPSGLLVAGLLQSVSPLTNNQHSEKGDRRSIRKWAWKGVQYHLKAQYE